LKPIIFPIEELQSIVSRSFGFSNPSGLVQEFGCFLFRGDSLIASDGFVGIIHALPITFEQDLLVPAMLFSRPIQSLSGDVTIRVEEGSVIIQSRGFKSKFPYLDLDKNRLSVAAPDLSEFKFFPKDFMASLNQVYFSVNKDETMVGLRGVKVDGQVFYSTDNFRISKYNYLLEKNESLEDLMIPDNLLIRILSEGEPDGYCLQGDRIWFTYEDFLVFGKLPSAPFSDCESIFGSIKSSLEESNKVGFDSSALSESLTRLSFFATAYPNRIHVLIFPSRMVLVAKNGEVEAVEQVICDTAATGAFSVNLNFFKQAVERSDLFYFGTKIYFLSTRGFHKGLEIVLMPLEDSSAEALMGRFSSEISVGGKEEAKTQKDTSSGRARRAKN